MKETLKQLVTEAIEALQAQAVLSNDISAISIQIERTRDKQFGDFACNVAMGLAKTAQLKPRDLAAQIIEAIPKHAAVEEITLAGPGFINFRLAGDAYLSLIPDILSKGDQFGLVTQSKPRKVNVEFVSANPTGPLHVGHGRSAAYGAVVSDLLQAAGYEVTREYYVNDAGRQMNILAVSVLLRYLESLGESFTFPVNGYKGDYIVELANALKEKKGDQFKMKAASLFENVPKDLNPEGEGDKETHIDGLLHNAKTLLGEKTFQELLNFSLENILSGIKTDLNAFRVHFDEWFSEKHLTNGAIQHAIETLTEKGHTYERDGALWFRSIPFGDDKDRVLVRENGQTTYFASDSAYLLNKIERGFEEIIYIFGADHHGYVVRLKAAAKALDINPDNIKILLVQFATLFRGKEKMQMSTRSGEFVTLKQLIDEVGADAARYFYIMRKAEQHMEFDLDLAKSQTTDNPVYYVQYAHARIASVFRQLQEKALSFDQALGLQQLSLLTESHEKTLLTNFARVEEVLSTAAVHYEPHLLANYLRELATDFHAYYNAHQFILPDANLRNARLCLILAVKQLLKNGLKLLSVSAPDSM